MIIFLLNNYLYKLLKIHHNIQSMTKLLRMGCYNLSLKAHLSICVRLGLSVEICFDTIVTLQLVDFNPLPSSFGFCLRKVETGTIN